MPDVLVTERIVGAPLDELRGSFDVAYEPDLWQSPERLLEMLPDCRALIVRNQTQVTADVISATKRLSVIGRAGVGLDNVDVTAASEAGIVVAYTPEQNSISVAELTLGLILALARKIAAADRDTRRGGWDRVGFMGIELHGKTLGIVGLGRIGFRVGLRARAFGMRLLACDAYANPDGVPATELDAPLVDLPALLRQADFVTCHVPLNSETRGMFDYDAFASMKPPAYFVNTSRGEVVDEAGLTRALSEGRLAGAALDVRAKEPPGPDALAQMDNVILTPHIASFSREAQHRTVASVCSDVAAVLRGGRATNYCNFPEPRK